MILVRLERNGASILTAVLALFYLLLGASTLGLARILGILGGAAVIALVVVGDRLRRGLRLAVLALAVVPFAVLTWWSVAVPLIGGLLLVIGGAATGTSRRR